jgi:hypothetical protein
MKHVSRFESFVNEEKSISDLGKRDEQPMVTGIASLLRKVRDENNRREIADSQIEEFKRDGIQFDYEEFLKLCNL